MRGLAIAIGLAIALSSVGLADASDLRVRPGSNSHFGSKSDDGPYYFSSAGEGFYVDCGRPTRAFADEGPGPNPNSTFFGPVGYRCIHGIPAYDPFIPPRCQFGYVDGPNGWVRVRNCR